VRFVLDTNIVVAGLLWNGKPRRIVNEIINGAVRCFTSEPLLIELERVLHYPRITKQLAKTNFSVQQWTDQYRRLATIVVPSLPAMAIARDPDDDQVIACALAAKAPFIVSGDNDLLVLKEHDGILIITADEALQIIDRVS